MLAFGAAASVLPVACRPQQTDQYPRSATTQLNVDPTIGQTEPRIDASKIETLNQLIENTIRSHTWDSYPRGDLPVVYHHPFASTRLTDLSQLVDITQRSPDTDHFVSDKFIRELLNFVDDVINKIIGYETDRSINPRFNDFLFIQSKQLYSKKGVLLLDILNRFKYDVQTGNVILLLAADQTPLKSATVGMVNDIVIEQSVPTIGRSFIYINPMAIHETYPISVTSTENVSLGMPSLMLLLFYEYTNRLITASKIEYLQQNYLQTNPVYSKAEFEQVLTQFNSLLFNQGERQSRDQNMMQLALFLSLKRLAGGVDLNFLTGAERHEIWPVFMAYLLCTRVNNVTDLLPLFIELSSKASY